MWIFGKHRHIGFDGLSEYASRRLPERENARIERAMAECALCREELDSINATRARLTALPQFDLTRSFVMTAPPAPAGRTSSPRPASLRRMPVLAGAGASSLVALAVGWFVLFENGNLWFQSDPHPAAQPSLAQVASYEAARPEGSALEGSLSEPTAVSAVAGAAGAAESAPAPAPQSLSLPSGAVAHPAAPPETAQTESAVEGEFAVEQSVQPDEEADMEMEAEVESAQTSTLAEDAIAESVPAEAAAARSEEGPAVAAPVPTAAPAVASLSSSETDNTDLATPAAMASQGAGSEPAVIPTTVPTTIPAGAEISATPAAGRPAVSPEATKGIPGKSPAPAQPTAVPGSSDTGYANVMPTTAPPLKPTVAPTPATVPAIDVAEPTQVPVIAAGATARPVTSEPPSPAATFPETLSSTNMAQEVPATATPAAPLARSPQGRGESGAVIADRKMPDSPDISPAAESRPPAASGRSAGWITGILAGIIFLALALVVGYRVFRSRKARN